MKYKRILLKLSGEALAGQRDYGICSKTLQRISQEVKDVHDIGTEMGIVIGGGNIHRGVSGATEGMDRTASDHMGMLATVINSIALQDSIERLGITTRLMTAIKMDKMAESYIRRRAIRHLEKKRVVIFAGGTGNPYFTTDTAASLRGSEIDAEIILKATKVDGVYDKDPIAHKDAIKYKSLTFSKALSLKLNVMDSTAFTFCMDNKTSMIVLNMFEIGSIKKAVLGESVGTFISG